MIETYFKFRLIVEAAVLILGIIIFIIWLHINFKR